jgi:hypothetical protein
VGKPFHDLRERLLRAGVAPRHVHRYLTELAEHFEDLREEEERSGRSRADAEARALARLGEIHALSWAMLEKRRFQSWSACAPWAVFGMGPLFLLGAAWFLALLILWSGWRIFLPNLESPFVPVNGPLEMLYFNAGRLLFFMGPLFIGWGIGLVAARQRSVGLWPILGLTPIAWLVSTAQVQAFRTAHDAAHVGVKFALGPNGIPEALLHSLALVTVMALPWLIWRLRDSVLRAVRHANSRLKA